MSRHDDGVFFATLGTFALIRILFHPLGILMMVLIMLYASCQPDTRIVVSHQRATPEEVAASDAFDELVDCTNGMLPLQIITMGLWRPDCTAQEQKHDELAEIAMKRFKP